MTRARRTVGRIAFVGAGPGDPGLLTMRAAEALAAASVVVTDPDVPADITALAADAEIRPAVGEPAEVAKTLVTAAKSGQYVVRLVAGDVLTADPVVKELQGVSAQLGAVRRHPGAVGRRRCVILRHRGRLGAHRRRRAVHL